MVILSETTRVVNTQPQPRALVACAGFGLVSLVLAEFGFDVTGIEIDDAIAAVNRANGGNCITANLLDVDPADFDGITLFQASLPCPNFSLAKNKNLNPRKMSVRRRVDMLAYRQRIEGGETALDMALARKTAEIIRVLLPPVVMLENVPEWAKSLSWLTIYYTLLECGYEVGAWKLCAADYGSPQTRHRMIVLARRDGIRPHKPFPTHAKTPDMFCRRWVGWLDAVSDLVPYLPDSEFAGWHKARMPAELLESIMIGGGNTNVASPSSKPRSADEPAFTVFASTGYFRERAFIVSHFDTSRAATIRQADEPIWTVRANEFRRPASVSRAFVMPLNGEHAASIEADRPAPAICASHVAHKFRASIEGRIVSMIPRCYARWMDLPDSFRLPASKSHRARTGQVVVSLVDELTLPGCVDNELSCKGIGNGVSLNLTRACLRSLGFEPVPDEPMDTDGLVAAWPRLSLKQRAAALWRLREEEKAR